MISKILTGPQNLGDSVVTAARGGQEGDLIVSQLRGKYAEMALRGNVFCASTLAAGIVVPFIAATLVSKFTLVNPAGSNKLVELIDINVLQVPGSALITGLGVAFQGPLAATGGYPGTLTVSTGAHASTRVGDGRAPPCVHYSAATHTNAAIANLTPVIWLFNNVATTIITQQNVNYQFDGRFLMPPDTAMCLVNSITGTQSAAAISVTYAAHDL